MLGPRLALGLLAVLLISGCGGARTPHPERIQSDLEDFSEQAEAPLESLERDDPLEARWNRGNRVIEIFLQTPKGPGPWPLVVYLPGLGQKASGGALWRETWVKSGFAVLGIQGERDRTALSRLSTPDRRDLKSIGRPHFAVGELNQRLMDLETVLRGVDQRAQAGIAPFSKVRPGAFAVAGFDLGAQTAQALLGETIRGLQGQPLSERVAAGVLLSPHVDVAAGGVQRRFQAIKAPLLVVTGTQDLDPWGMSSPSVREAAFQQAGASHKILLTLHEGTHRQMAGIDPLSESPEDQELDLETLESTEENSREPSSRREMATGGPGASPYVVPTRSLSPTYNPRHAGQQLAGIEVISALFLRESLSQDPRARDWLKSQAARWLGSAGRFQIR